ncbi:Nucleobase cation symporter-1, NCS1 [Cordyceps fumosorosea ARSEF 2679]|uniref:Nucleobase cation symporter-1, NCS1 n=1 Tax=Cordyceps fumosorosea (strain ARSEF 2679) TaxID=1081104 RepID=A0A167UCS0_CORFA|nr:Nucleobase cation symporter-1, NCS1 [Cordyceps fumosorosea ARSEF 2679]OAA61456.1 Nucleobase cation symporter-1, NCS1 [Cordyceps fumosorosea ARSEF 2679]
MPSFSQVLDYLKVPTKLGNERNYWINDDVRPLPPSRRTWDSLTFFSFQAINQIAISNWQIGSSLVATGLSVWQTIVAVILGKIIIAAVQVFGGWIGAEWHVGYPVIARLLWGIYGSFFAVAQRQLLSLVWFALQSWFGGLFTTAVLSSVFPQFHYMKNTMPASTHMTTAQFVGWVVFLLISLPVMYLPPEKTKKPFAVMNTIAFVTLVAIMIWALVAAGGAGPLVSASATVSNAELAWAIIRGVTTTVGGIAAALTNASDWSRFARRPGDQVTGQWTAIISLGTIMPLFGCLTTSATVKIYGTPLWNPADIILRWLQTDYSSGSRAAAFFAGAGMITSQLAINTVDNAFSLGMDLSGIFPTYVNIRRGGYIGLIVSCALCPWYLLSSASTFVTVLSSYSLFLAPMMGIQICDYWIVRKRKIELSQLYTADRDGSYYYWHGVNWRTVVAWVLGWAPQFPGFLASVAPRLRVTAGAKHLYDMAFVVGFLISVLVYYGLVWAWPPKGLGAMDATDIYGTFTAYEGERLGVQQVIEGQGQDLGAEKELKRSSDASVTKA